MSDEENCAAEYAECNNEIIPKTVNMFGIFDLFDYDQIDSKIIYKTGAASF